MRVGIFAAIILAFEPTIFQATDVCTDDLFSEFEQGTLLLQMQMQYIGASRQVGIGDSGNSTELRAEMTAIREKNDMILFAKKVSHPYPKHEPILLRLGELKAPQVQITWLVISFVVFVIMFVIVSVAVTLYCDRKHVEMQEQEEHVAERGRKCWLYCAFISLFLFSVLIYMMTLSMLIAANKKIEEEPTKTENMNGQEVTETSYVMTDLGLRCVEATMGCVLSAALAAVTIANWRKWGNVGIKPELLIIFFVRGMTLSIVFTTLTEFPGLFLAQTGEGASGSYHFYLFTLLDMAIVGFTEEGSKLAALICCTYLSVRSLENAPPSCCARPCVCRMLCESPRAFILAGLAVGYGFMTTENGEYMAAIASTPVTTYETSDTTDATPDMRMENLFSQLIIILQILVRNFLNIHPWLVGISAARILSICWTNEPDLSQLGFTGFMWAVCPSAVAHCIYDFLVSVTFPLVQLLTPIVIFTFSRTVVYDKWIEAPPEPKGLVLDVDETKDAAVGVPIKAAEAAEAS